MNFKDWLEKRDFSFCEDINTSATATGTVPTVPATIPAVPVGQNPIMTGVPGQLTNRLKAIYPWLPRIINKAVTANANDPVQAMYNVVGEFEMLRQQNPNNSMGNTATQRNATGYQTQATNNNAYT